MPPSPSKLDSNSATIPLPIETPHLPLPCPSLGHPPPHPSQDFNRPALFSTWCNPPTARSRSRSEALHGKHPCSPHFAGSTPLQPPFRLSRQRSSPCPSLSCPTATPSPCSQYHSCSQYHPSSCFRSHPTTQPALPVYYDPDTVYKPSVRNSNAPLITNCLRLRLLRMMIAPFLCFPTTPD